MKDLSEWTHKIPITKRTKPPRGSLKERLIIDFIIRVLKVGVIAYLHVSAMALDSHSGERAVFSIAQVQQAKTSTIIKPQTKQALSIKQSNTRD